MPPIHDLSRYFRRGGGIMVMLCVILALSSLRVAGQEDPALSASSPAAEPATEAGPVTDSADAAMASDSSAGESGEGATAVAEPLPPGAPKPGLLSGDLGDTSQPVEINGDEVEFFREENRVVARGNVEVVQGDLRLFCDELEFDRTTSMAYARGNVVLIRGDERLNGERLVFNFETKLGDFSAPRLSAKPFFGYGEEVEKIGDNHVRIHNGYITTSDFDEPEYRIVARSIDVYPGDKAVSRNIRLKVGKVPILYFPRFTQDLRNKEPWFEITPGYESDWGAFVLTKWKYRINDYIDGRIRLDYRQRKDLAWGIDVDYRTPGFGEGLLRTYYMNERNVNAKYFWDDRDPPTIERERYRAEWRHKWNIDSRTMFIGQYYKLSDGTILKDYFEREFDEDTNPDTFFVVTRGLGRGTMSVRNDVRVNRFTSKLEKLPEVSYSLPTTSLFGSGFYLDGSSTYSNLMYKDASPSDSSKRTMRVHLDKELAYPFKLAFVEVTPHVGGTGTYYSRTVDPEHYDAVRGQLRTGADLSTKFFRTYDLYSNTLGMNINRLRHVITPSVAYDYYHDPSLDSSKLLQFDEIDALQRGHTIHYSLENKLQTKRSLRNVDLTRLILGSDYRLKGDPGEEGFVNVTADWEVHPLDWLSFSLDSSYDTILEQLTDVNFDLYLNQLDDPWFFSLGHRYHVDADDQIVTEFGYTINPKWKFRTYHRMDTEQGTMAEQEYALQRDLHSWLMEINFNDTRNEGSEIWMVWTLKAFPDLGFDFGTNFNRSQAGSQVN